MQMYILAISCKDYKNPTKHNKGECYALIGTVLSNIVERAVKLKEQI